MTRLRQKGQAMRTNADHNEQANVSQCQDQRDAQHAVGINVCVMVPAHRLSLIQESKQLFWTYTLLGKNS